MIIAPDDNGEPHLVIGHGHENLVREIQRALTIDMERTLEQDVRLGFRQLADIAVKALSPGINDPTTAMMCIDRLGEALIRARALPDDVRMTNNDRGRPLLVQQRAGFASFLNISVQQIRHFGAGDATVITHLLRTLNAIVDGATIEIRTMVATEARIVLEEALLATELPADRLRLHGAAAWAE